MRNLNRNSEQGRKITGFFLLAFGGLLFIKSMGIGLPWWVFSWEMFLIGLGLYIGLKHNFKNPAAYILIFIGTIFLWDDMTIGTNIKPFVWPIALIASGLYFLLKPKRNKLGWESDEKSDLLGNTFSKEDGIDSVVIFGGTKKTILSKAFKGGDIVNIFGGTELNFMQADIEGPIKIDAVNLMGGTKLIIPAHWDVQSEVVSIFGGIDDKRLIKPEGISNEKIIHLEGVNIFGGIEIKSY